MIFFLILLVSLAGSLACEFGPTSCTCSYSGSSGTCFKPVSTTACIATPCLASWKCDCLRPTHMCSRLSCTQFQAVQGGSIPEGADTRCHAVSNATCVQVRGDPIAPLSELSSPAPSSSTSTVPAASSEAAPTPAESIVSTPSVSLSSPEPTGEGRAGGSCSLGTECVERLGSGALCILGNCVGSGQCTLEMVSYCSALFDGAMCCDLGTPCSKNLVHQSFALCNTACTDSCFDSTNVYPCVFRSGGSAVGSVDQSNGAVPGSPLSECPVIF